MNYERLRNGMANFVENPHDNADYLKELYAGLSWKVKLLFYFPTSRKRLSSEDSKKLFYRVVHEYLVRNRPVAQFTTPIGDSILSREEIDNIVANFGGHFSISSNISSSDAYVLRYLSEFIRFQIPIKLEYHYNRVCESLKIPFGSLESILSTPTLWLSFYYSELCLLVDSDVLEVKFHGNSIHLIPVTGFEKVMRQYWFSEAIEGMSTQSDNQNIKDLLVMATKQRRLSSKIINTAVDFILDKVFSIHVMYLGQELKSNESYLLLRKLIAFSIFIERNFLLGVTETTSSEICVQAGLDKNFLAIIDNVITNPACESNSFVVKAGDAYRHGTLGFKYGLKTLAGDIFHYREKNLGEINFGGVLGGKFEILYLSEYVKRCSYRSYKVYPGLKSKKGKDNVLGYDVDFIFYDIERNFYYFVQVKYSVHKLPKYFSEQYRFFNDANFIGKGSRQIRIFKDHCFSDVVIQKKLKNLGLGGASNDNSAFLVVHNIPYLNFYENDGVVFYEWNTFRSILNGGIQFAKVNGKVHEVNIGFKGEFENPSALIEGYFNEKLVGPHFNNAYQAFCSMMCISKIENYSLYSKML